ncbi:GDSL-type esterase/lipase family protein [Halobacillus yeomjeoni]|uniref:Esterase n=1 Tax=Halobacillus yeomjeoni TaxID=311194 RepID=A0A931HTY2_9BACI|nr:GDSL-type esterase/lipase family protein [Halobacillus yeomjeoni]MBH0229386.1 esterase [Halobacillus yeomjeoni]MCA0983208.1 GDSL-type esterase/lipase family protein [Halobacillus yeomjeoni]
MARLVCFGDSITARREGFSTSMLTTKLAEQLETFEVFNEGKSGGDTCDALQRIEDVQQHDPDVVTVLFGSNDAAFHKMVDLDTYKANLIEIVRRLQPAKSILITPPPVDEDMQVARTNDELEIYGRAVKEVSKETGSDCIDLFSEMISMNDYKEILHGSLNDGLHFGEKGYNVLVPMIVDKLQSIDLDSDIQL